MTVRCAALGAALLSIALMGREAHAQVPGQPSVAPYGYGYGYPTSSTSRARTSTEMAVLYSTAALYGVGLGVWFGAEVGIDDPALFLIAPAVLGVGAPAAVYALDNPTLRRGVPSAIAAGTVIGAGAGIGIASLQFVSASREDAWGFRGLSRATALGATLGTAGGAALGFLQQPSPRSSLLMTSGVAWGSVIGAAFGYGSSAQGIGYGRANDSAARGGLIGYGLGLAATGALSTLYVPSYTSLSWMWAGAGIGFVASLPVYLFYAGEGGPPAKRGLVLSGTAMTLGLAAGALFTLHTTDSAGAESPRGFARVTGVAPLASRGGLGLAVTGELQ